MSARRHDIGTPRRQGSTLLDVARDGASAACGCSATSFLSPAGVIIVLRVAGEVDLVTRHLLRTALAAGLGQRACHLLVDLAGVTFCDVRGLDLLVDAGRTAAGNGTGYAISAASRQADRVWSWLWPENDLPVRYPTAAAGILAALSRQAAVRNVHGSARSTR